MTQKDLSANLGVAPRYIGNIEQGHRAPSLEMLVEMCEWFNVGMSDIMPLKTKQTEKAKMIDEIVIVLNAWEPQQIGMLKAMVSSLNR
ncbi:MAG: helix-turn-helix domain-containing protein [Defluviitaleaceae bacterium]|nr:helix-turn-helix domain-containing protein [Defluviitaleaceae bacterium]